MRVVDKILEDNLRKNNRNVDDEPDQVEIYMEKPFLAPLDTAKSVFDEGAEQRWGGINTRRSVFDEKAVFRVGRGD